jgi:hypothetical protein
MFKHKRRMQGTENLPSGIEQMRDRSKLGVFCAVLTDFLAELAVVGTVYLGMSEQRLVPILQEEGNNNILFEQDGHSISTTK